MGIQNKWKSSSLVEVIVAMTILAIVISITIGIIYKLSDTRHKQKLRAFNALTNLSFETKRDQSYINSEEDLHGFLIERNVGFFDAGLLKIVYTAKINDKLIAEIEEVVRE